MSARYVSSKLIQAIQKGTKSIQVEYVNKTDAWVRLDNFPATSLQSDIVTVVKENIDKLNPETAIVAMKESEHQSDMDKRMHFTGYELNKDREVICTTHFVKQK